MTTNKYTSLKYDLVLDQLCENSSYGKILSQITPGSFVLECGCATGYMTRWMTEKLNCQVSVIEIDPAGYEKALPYAKDGFCGDLMKGACYEHFSGRLFDFILFADVLEHVNDPSYALKKAETLLAEDGKILISIPNIAHNDILIKLFDNHFDYTPTGLLDNTHIHFWGKNNLKNFCSEAELKIVRIDGVRKKTGTTEQFENPDLIRNEKDSLIYALSQREFGEIYQYILTVQKQGYAENINLVEALPDFGSELALQASSILQRVQEEKNRVVTEKQDEIDKAKALYEQQIAEQHKKFENMVNQYENRITEKEHELEKIIFEYKRQITVIKQEARNQIVTLDTIIKDREECLATAETINDIQTKQISQFDGQISKLEEQIHQLKKQLRLQESKYQTLTDKYDILVQSYNEISGSFFWKLSGPIRKTMDRVKAIYRRKRI